MNYPLEHLVHGDSRLLLKGLAFVEPVRVTLPFCILEARIRARQDYIDGQCHGSPPAPNPYPRHDLCHDLYREAAHIEGRDLYDVLRAAERSRP